MQKRLTRGLGALAVFQVLVAGCGTSRIATLATMREVQIRSSRLEASVFEREIAESLKRAKAMGVGPVVVGRLMVADGAVNPRQVYAQMQVFPGGYFAGEIGDRHKPVRFLLHGYEPYDLVLRSSDRGDVVDVGELVIRPLTETSRARLKGRVALGPDGKPRQAVVTLSVALDADEINHPSKGVQARDGDGWPAPLVLPIRDDGSFEASGCSPASYYLDVQGTGLAHNETVRLKAGQTVDVGTIESSVLAGVAIRYVASPRPSFEAATVQTAAVGVGQQWRAAGEHWKPIEKQYGPGYGFSISFLPAGRSVNMHVFHQPAIMADLGPGRLEDFVRVDPRSVALQHPKDAEPKDGHVYLMHHQVFNYWTLFEVHIEPASTPVPASNVVQDEAPTKPISAEPAVQ